MSQLFEREINRLRERAKTMDDRIEFGACREAIEALEGIEYRLKAAKKFQEGMREHG